MSDLISRQNAIEEINKLSDLICRQDAIDAADCYEIYMVDDADFYPESATDVFLKIINSLPSAEPRTAIIIYNFLKKKIGSKIIDNPFEFEDWYNRMIWHVQEYYKLRKKYESDKMSEPKTGKWVRSHTGTIGEGFYCSRCGKLGYKTNFCPSCGARME